MKRMKRLVCCLMALAMIIPAAAMAENSWGQINQSLERGADWVRYVENPEAFSLGDTKPLEGSLSSSSSCSRLACPAIMRRTLMVSGKISNTAVRPR